MTDELRIMISAKIPVSLHDSIIEAVNKKQFKDKTTCITVALDKLLRYTQREPKDVRQDIRPGIQVEINKIESILQDIPDKMEYTKLQVRLEEKDKQIRGTEQHIEALKKEIENIKQVHNNYMMQMQVLINQKVIEAPGAKKRWWQFW
jgi:Arc/MetJ-type ribon-helix-helix transcriptional regulator